MAKQAQKPQSESTTITIKLDREERKEWGEFASEAGLDGISVFVKMVVRQHIKAAKVARESAVS